VYACRSLFMPSQKWSFPISSLKFNQITKPNLSKFKVEQTLPSEDELERQIEQLIKEGYQGSTGLPFVIIIAIAIWIIIFSAIWLAWI